VITKPAPKTRNEYHYLSVSEITFLAMRSGI
jgi:hypothetical protein